MKAILTFTLPEDDAEFLRAVRAGDAFRAVAAFSEYLKWEEDKDAEERDDLVAVRRVWFETFGDLLEIE